MTGTSLGPVVRERRDAVIAELCEHFARDNLDAAGLERMIDRAHGAGTLAELDALVAELPALAYAQATRPSAYPSGEARNEHQVVIAIMGGAQRRGPWKPARRIYVTAVMGGVVLDFRDAELEAGITEVYVVAVMGGVEIIVPPQVAVDSSGIGIMGGFDHRGNPRFPVDATTPILRVSGLALMGGVEVRERPQRDPAGGRRALSREEKRRLKQGEPRDGSGWNS